MENNLNNANIIPEFSLNDVNCYKVEGLNLLNNYYIISEEESRKLMNHPEIVGYDVFSSLLKSTSCMLNYLNKQNKIYPVSILDILRGALNFPIEESCKTNNIPVHDISFLSCERVFDKNGNISGLAVNYEKIEAVKDSTLLIGDILASGETLAECLRHVIDYYKQNNAQLRNIILFTIGGTRAFSLLEKFTEEIRQYWPDFEGFVTVFYEGVFSCYEPGDNGISGINRPLIDFIWKDGIISPEFRHQTLTLNDALFEKCIIYDGGARRFNLKEHIDEVLEFWNEILERANKIDPEKLLEEKLGHKLPISYEEWVLACHYKKLDEDTSMSLYQQELDFVKVIKNASLKQIAERRIKEFKSSLKLYD